MPPASKTSSLPPLKVQDKSCCTLEKKKSNDLDAEGGIEYAKDDVSERQCAREFCGWLWLRTSKLRTGLDWEGRETEQDEAARVERLPRPGLGFRSVSSSACVGLHRARLPPSPPLVVYPSFASILPILEIRVSLFGDLQKPRKMNKLLILD